MLIDLNINEMLRYLQNFDVFIANIQQAVALLQSQERAAAAAQA